MLENFAKISAHLESKVGDPRRFLSSLKTHENKDHFLDGEGNFWRLVNFQEDHRNFVRPSNIKESFEAAKAFGLFQKLFLDFNPQDLHITINDFHSPEKRLADYESALKKDVLNRADQSLWVQECVRKHIDLVEIFNKLKKEIPIRVVHNDAKLSNVLLDNESGEGLCVIDLDTVMPGFAIFDFGDLVRSMAAPREDERDLDNIKIDPEYFKSRSEGFLHHTKGFLTNGEKDNLLFGAKLIIYLLGMRFFTDFLNGDNYFKIDYPNHNLVRAQNQFKLLGSLLAQESELDQILKAI